MKRRKDTRFRTASVVRHGKRFDLTRDRSGVIAVSEDGCTPVVWRDQTLAHKLWAEATRPRCVENPRAMLAVIEFERDSVES